MCIASPARRRQCCRQRESFSEAAFQDVLNVRPTEMRCQGMIEVVRTSRTIRVGIAGKRANLGLSRSNSVRKSDVDLVFLCTSFRRDPSWCQVVAHNGKSLAADI